MPGRVQGRVSSKYKIPELELIYRKERRPVQMEVKGLGVGAGLRLRVRAVGVRVRPPTLSLDKR